MGIALLYSKKLSGGSQGLPRRFLRGVRRAEADGSGCPLFNDGDADPDGADADMAGNAAGEGRVGDGTFGEGGPDQEPPLLRILVGLEGSGGPDPQPLRWHSLISFAVLPWLARHFASKTDSMSVTEIR